MLLSGSFLSGLFLLLLDIRHNRWGVVGDEVEEGLVKLGVPLSTIGVDKVCPSGFPALDSIGKLSGDGSGDLVCRSLLAPIGTASIEGPEQCSDMVSLNVTDLTGVTGAGWLTMFVKLFKIWVIRLLGSSGLLD